MHYFAVLIGVGATTVNAYLAQESIADRHARGLFGDAVARGRVGRYKKAVDEGLLKIMSKMGISVISSYRGGYNFEAVGLSRATGRRILPRHASRAFPASACPASPARSLDLHRRAWDEDVVALPVGGFYKLRRSGEAHAFDGAPDPHAADRGGERQLLAPIAAIPTACAGCRRSRCATCWISAPMPCSRSRSTRSKASPKSASASWRRACRWARSARRRTRRCPSP